MAENITYQTKDRRRYKLSYRWGDIQTRELIQEVLNVVKANPGGFEKPISQRFYENIAENSELLKGIPWNCMKNRLRHCKSLFLAAKKYKDQAEGDPLTSGEDRSVTNYINRVCPHFELIKQIFNINESVVPPAQTIKQIKISHEEYLNDSMQFSSEELSGSPTNDNSSRESRSDPNTIQGNEMPNSPTSLDDFEEFSHVDELAMENADSSPLLLAIQKQKLELEWRKLDWQIEKEKIQLEQQFKLKKLELERDERLRKEQIILQNQTEEKVKIYELELKYKNNKNMDM